MLSHEVLVSINEKITRSYGPDIAQDVTLAMLRRRNPIRKPMAFARGWARGLSRREATRLSKMRTFSDMSQSKQSLLAEILGY